MQFRRPLLTLNLVQIAFECRKSIFAFPDKHPASLATYLARLAFFLEQKNGQCSTEPIFRFIA